ncbi:MAG TPA: choice-of-anchor tandem repeat GloVer-containing protein [Terriglobales bacterium]|jgi:uncharacterized repeat protein (TIGR03803 family)|nr:choice-of-anchor tandem repeat GloVer-containing protein [Terriglobales bacterium]
MARLNAWKWAGVIALLWAASTTAAGAQTFKTLLSFGSSSGRDPEGSLVQGSDGNFYGTTYQGVGLNDGTVFKVTPDGVLTTLRSFHGNDGYGPVAGLVQGTNGSFYRTTVGGGANGGAQFSRSLLPAS